MQASLHLNLNEEEKILHLMIQRTALLNSAPVGSVIDDQV
jgi:hypothetical protein